MAIYLVRLARRRHSFHRALPILLAAAIFSLLAVGHVNFLLDDGVSSAQQTAHVSRSRQTYTGVSPRYLLEVRLPNKERELDVPKDVYEALEWGDDVLVETYMGPLGIAYSEACLPDR